MGWGEESVGGLSFNIKIIKTNRNNTIIAPTYMVQLNLNFTHTCRYMRVLAHLLHAKVKKLACASTVACDFGVHMWDSKHTRHTRDARHELALGLPH